MSRPLRWLAAVGLLGLSGCVINSEGSPRPRDLSPGWRVDKLRLLAIQAEPPELAPGQTATFTSLLIDPDASVDSTIWVSCTEEQATDFGCPFDPTVLQGEPDPEALAEAGVIGIEPFLAPVFTADGSVLDGLEARDRQEGVNITITALSLPATSGDAESFDFNQVEAGFKRLVVSEADAPNRNPTLLGFAVDQIPVQPGRVVVVDAGEPYEIAPVLSDDAVQTYDYINLEGVTEERTEQLYVEWFTSGGTLNEDVTLDPFLDATWIAPAEPGLQGTWWAVVKDRRGGLAWVQQDWRTR